MRPLSIASELPAYGAANSMRLPTYDEQWDDDSVLGIEPPAPAHLANQNSYALGSLLEAGQMSAPSLPQPARQNPAARVTAPQTQTTQRRGCLGSACGKMTVFVCVPGAILAGGAMLGIGFVDDNTTIRNIGIGVATFGLVFGAMLRAGK